VVRPQALDDVKTARAHGDLSENFEYKAAKQFKNQNESRIRHLERMIRTAQVIEEDSQADEVGLNDRVTIFMEEENAEEVFKIVTTVRSNPLKGLISIESPLGKAVLSHKEGDKVTVFVSPDYSYHAVIKKIEKLEDTGEDELRKY